MGLQYSAEANSAALDAKIAILGPSPVLKIYAGGAHRNCASGDLGQPIATINLPSPWMGKAVNGLARSVGTWKGTVTTRGRASCFRICSKDGKCHIQGLVADKPGVGEIILANLNMYPEQVFIVDNFSLRAGNG